MRSNNIIKLYLLNLLSGIVFWYPIEKLFLQDIHINTVGISINAIIFLIIQIVFDIPSGVLADKWNRKYVLLLAMIALTFGSLVGGVSNGLPEYLLATVLVGGFVVLTSGTFQAVMYDSLRDQDKQSEYDKHQGRAYALFLAGLSLSSFLGGYMADMFDYRATYFATAAVMTIAALITLTLKEPRAHKAVTDKKLLEHVRFSIRQIKTSQLLMQLTLLITAANILRGSQNEYAGLFFIALGLGAIPIGYATAFKWLTSAVGQLIAPKIGRSALRLVPIFFITFTLFSLIPSLWSLPLFFLASFLYAIISNQAETAIQDNTPSEIRATTLSLLSFTSNILLIPLGLLFGWIALQSVFNAYLMIAIVGLVYLISWLFRGRKMLSRIYKTSSKNSLPAIGIDLS
jgi:MFS family permease